MESPSYGLSHGSLATLNTLSIAPKHHIIFQRLRSVSGSGIFGNDADMAFAAGRSERKIVALPTGTPAEILDALKHLAAVTFPTHAARLPPGVSVTICIDDSPVGAPPGSLTLIELDDDASIEFFLNAVHSGADRRTASGLPAVLLFFSVAEAEPAAASVAEESELGGEASGNLSDLAQFVEEDGSAHTPVLPVAVFASVRRFETDPTVLSVDTTPGIRFNQSDKIREMRQAAGDQCVQLFLSHDKDSGCCMALSPDGKFLAICFEEVSVYDVATGAELYSLLLEPDSCRTQREIVSVAWAPGGKTLAVAQRELPISLFPVPGSSMGCGGITLQSHDAKSDNATFVAFSPDGRLLATGSPISLWNTAGRKYLLDAGHELTCMEFSPDGNFLATSQRALRVKLWSPVDGSCVKTIETSSLGAFSWSPDGAVLALATVTYLCSNVKLCQVSTNKIIGIYENVGVDGHIVKWSPDGTMIVAGSCLLHVDSGKIEKMPSLGEVNSVAWMLDSEHVIANYSYILSVGLCGAAAMWRVKA